MKLNKYIYILFIQFMFIGLVNGQSEDKSKLDNGRPAGVVAKMTKKQDTNPSRSLDNYRGGSDLDSGAALLTGNDESSWSMPLDLDMLLDMIENESNGRIDDDASGEISSMKVQMENLIIENLKMKESLDFMMSNLAGCCDIRQAKKIGEFQAYLLQSMPNPTVDNASISFNIPDAFSSASLKFFDMSGQIIKSVNITENGFNTINIEGDEFSPGSYIYTLVVDGKAVQSKVMNVAQ